MNEATRIQGEASIARYVGRLRLDFADERGRAAYTLAMASLFSTTAEQILATQTDLRSRDDLDIAELQARLRAGRISSVHIRVGLGSGSEAIAIQLDGTSPGVANVLLPLAADEEIEDNLWLQADPEFLCDPPVLALPVGNQAFAPDALHALVALARRNGALIYATLTPEGSDAHSHRWWADKPPAEAQALEGMQGDTLWRVAPVGAKVDHPVAWYANEEAIPKAASRPPNWQTTLHELSKTPAAFEALEAHLRSAVPKAPRFRLADIAHTPRPQFMTPPEDEVVVMLVPGGDCVTVALDTQQPSEIVAALLVHALAHIALGHIRRGDRWGHWDTAKSVTSPAPHRMWDREAFEFALHLLPTPVRRVESLEECTALEKAQLGLWRMIGEMLGESRRLHVAAERYQRAAYQRQAAQRLVSMLEDYGGAMLCDGVGLGKTYVATTVIVHYMNLWRERWASSPDRQIADPFRVTILAPQSVVSTWRREALPGLAVFGVPSATVRVVSHTQLSRMSSSSELLEPLRGGLSDLEHLLLSDLVVVDEAHNFRSLAARRTKVLRDLLRVQPRREQRRRVLLLTATPINNSLDDLRQELSLLFSRALLLSTAKTDDGYRRQAVKEIQDRCARARSFRGRGDVSALVIHGQPDARYSDAIEFRDDLDLGPNVQRIGDYLKEQDQQLKELQDRIRAAAQNGNSAQTQSPIRIAEDLLDRIVVQRSRALCKKIEEQQSSHIDLLFRPDADPPEKLRYSDEYDGIQDVLARFMPLFDAAEAPKAESPARTLSLKIYMWYDVREGIKSSDDISSVVGLQRALVLKRLESSPVSFLITLLRLAVLHAHRLHQLGNLCSTVSDMQKQTELRNHLSVLLDRHEHSSLAKIRSLATGETAHDRRADFVKTLAAAYSADRPAADTDDPPPQISLFDDESESGEKSEELNRLWLLHESILRDFDTLLSVTPQLADIVFGRFAQTEWPQRFIAGGESIDWPTSAAWGLRLVTDAKIRQLVARLIIARRAGQKAVVFSQFSDTIAYIWSVLQACRNLSHNEWQLLVRGLGVPHLRSEELSMLLDRTEIITGDTENRDELVNSFAPFYRIGPFPPSLVETQGGAQRQLLDAWEVSWTGAILRPVDVLLSTDILAEGVNLQDAALVINFDVHWNPVRMIQRAGRIDRRLNPRIELAHEFPDLATLAARLHQPAPRYYWQGRNNEAPVTVNMILPDALEAELLLRERIATKTLAIDFTLGLEQGTGAEADWMAAYQYRGITSLNSLQRDRAIEQIGGHHERLSRSLSAVGIHIEWAENLNGWLRCKSADAGSPLVGRALLGRRGGALEKFNRYLQPTIHNGIPFWFWAEKRAGESAFDGWLILDGKAENFPPRPRNDIPFNDNVAMPLKAPHLLAAAEYLSREQNIDSLAASEIGRILLQGASAIAAPKLGSEDDRRSIAVRDFFILQLKTFEQTPR